MHTTYTAARLYTGLAETTLEHGAVTIAGETIVYAGEAAGAPASGERVDLGDVTLMPGLIDMHVHLTLSASANPVADYLAESDALKLLRGAEHARRALIAGVTTVRECGGQNAHVFALRQASEQRLIAAPRIIAAGGSITTTGGHCWFFGLEADTEEELRRAVRGQIKAGADFIKIMATGGAITPRSNPVLPQYDEQQLQTVVAEAHRAGLRVSAHCHATEGVRHAARAGVTTIEHCSFQTPGGYVYDEAVAREVAAAGCYVCPTLAIGERVSHTLPEDHHMVQFKRTVGPTRYANFRRLYDLGVPLVSGSDAGVTYTPFEDFAFNLTLLVEQVGLSPHAALATATTHAAAALGRPDLGSLAAGKSADLIAVRGNPLEDIRALWDIALVVARGERYR